jgi:hypothetical protein
MAETRTFYRDIKPYDVPARLQDLHGPAHGTVTLPLNVYWGPDPDADLDSLAGITKAYQAALREGRTEDLEQIVNANRLTEVWDELLLPARVRTLWESRFPELASA